jgi:hypothetical protein
MLIWLRVAAQRDMKTKSGLPITKELLWSAWVKRELPVYMAGTSNEAGYDHLIGAITHAPNDAASDRIPNGIPAGDGLPIEECELSRTPVSFPLAQAKLCDAAGPEILRLPPKEATELLADASNLVGQFFDICMSMAGVDDDDLRTWAEGKPLKPECWSLEMLATRMNPKSGASADPWVGRIVGWLENRPDSEAWDMRQLARSIHHTDPNSISEDSLYDEIRKHRRRFCS